MLPSEWPDAEGGPATPSAEGAAWDEVSAGMSQLIETLFVAGDEQSVWNRLVTVTVESLDGCDSAGVFLLVGAEVTAPAATDTVAADLDALQQQLSEGPCFDAITSGGTVYAPDLAEGSPWPRWGPAAVGAGVRSALALALGAEGHRGALNCYGAYPEAFGIVDRGKAQMLAALGGQALATAGERQAANIRTGNLETALVTREVIGQAQGILMERERVSADQAFDILRRASQHLNVRLREVAQRLVDTGEDPEGPSPLKR